LADEIRETYPDAKVVLVEGSGGVFEVTLDGALVYSKIETGRHAEPGEVLHAIQDHRGT